MRVHGMSNWLAALALAGGAALAAAPAQAAVPLSTPIEGLLYSAGGGPAADGTYAMTVSIYSSEVGGSPVWTEGPLAVTAKSGEFSIMLGSKTPLSPAALSLQNAWIGVQVATDPELPRRPAGATFFALRAAVAEALECSGCVKADALDAAVLQPYAKTTDLAAYAKATDLTAYAKATDLAAYAKIADLAAYAKTSDLGAYAKTTDLSAYVKAASLAKVAGSGDYADLANKPVLAKVATTGDYADLANKPGIPTVGKLCGTGLYMKGYNADGSLACQDLVEGDMPADGIDEVSNGLINNQFVDSQAGTGTIKIPDGLGAGVTDTLTFPDIGLAQKIWINMNIANSDLTGVKVELYAPGVANAYVLFNGGKTGTSLVTNFNTDTPLVSGDMNGDWVGKNIKGAWSITVKDVKAGGGSGGFDGTFTWSVNIQTLSSKKIQVKGNLIVDGTLNGYTPAQFTGGQTYIHWGGSTCGTGWSAVSTGASALMVERQTWGRANDVICLEGGLANDQGTGVEWSYRHTCSHYQNSAMPCAVCAPDQGPGRPAGQCFTKFGSNACPSGWTLMVDGYITSALEWQSWGQQGATMCMDKTALTNCSGNGGIGATWAAYQTDNFESPRACAVCCR